MTNEIVKWIGLHGENAVKLLLIEAGLVYRNVQFCFLKNL